MHLTDQLGKNRWLSLRIKSDIETWPTSIVSSKRRRGTRRENFAGPSTPTASNDLVRIAASMLAVPGRSGMNFSNPLTCPEESCGVNFAFLEPGVQGQKSGVQLVSDKRCPLGSKRHLGSHPQPLFSISDPVHESLSRRYRRSTTGRIRRVHRAHHLAFSSSKGTILLVQSHVRASFTSRLTALTSPRISAGENRRVINEMPMESQQPRFTEQSR